MFVGVLFGEQSVPVGELKVTMQRSYAGLKMNKKIVWVILFTSLLCALSLAGVHVVKADSSGPISFSDGITLLSPVNSTYNSRFLTLNYTFACGWTRYSINYTLDGLYSGPMPCTITNPEELHVVYHSTGSVQLPELSEGSHRLIVDLEADFNEQNIRSYSDTVYFTIDTNAPDFVLDTSPPSITIQLPQNNTIYTTTTNTPLIFILSESTTSLTRVLDGNRTSIPAQNATLTGLTTGQHSITMIAVDVAGNTGVSGYVQFSITDLAPTTPPPTTQAAATKTPEVPLIGVILAVFAVGCYVVLFASLSVIKKKT
jgi:hypothetical protein